MSDMMIQVFGERIGNLLIDSFDKILIPGITQTIPLTILSFAFAMVIAVITALIQFARVPVLTRLARIYIWIMRGTPVLVQLYVVYYGLATVGIKFQSAFWAAVLVFSFNEGAYCAETLRGALESVPGGQIEAGYCVGMNYLQIMSRIVLPQAFRTAFPALSNSLIGMLKSMSLAYSIGVPEMYAAMRVAVGVSYEVLWLYLEIALIYLLMSTLITWLQRVWENKLNAMVGLKEAKHA